MRVTAGTAIAAGVAVWLVLGGTADAKKKKRGKVQVSGYLQAFFKARIDQDDSGDVEPALFRIQRARIRVEGEVTPCVSYQVEIDPRAPEIGGVMRDAYIAFALKLHQELRIGQQKTQFGYENVESSTNLYTVNRSEVSENLSRGATLRDIGIGLIGRIPLGGGYSLEDALTVVNGAGMNVQADDTAMKNVWGRVGMRYGKKKAAFRWRAGISGAIGDQVEPDDPGPPPVAGFEFDFRRVGADLEVDTPWVFVATEFVFSWDEIAGETESNGGGYVLAAGKTKWRVGPLARYDALGDFWRVTAGAYYGLPGERIRAMVNYEILEDEDGRHDDKLYAWTQVLF